MYPRLLLLAVTLAALFAAVPAASVAPPREKEARSIRDLLPPPKEPKSRVWRGRWIWTGGEPAPRNSYTYFRKTLDLSETPREAKIHLTADSRYHLYVNGAFVGRGPVRSDRRWLYYDTWPLAPHLKKGKNAIAVLVHHIGESTFSYMKGRGGLIADVLGSGGLPLAQTDASWKALRSKAWSSAGPRMSLQLGFNEVFDARQAPAGWKDAAFEDSSWPHAQGIGAAGMEPWPNPVSRDIPPLAETPVAPLKVLDVAEVQDTDPEKPLVSQVMASGEREPLRRGEVSGQERLLERGSSGARIKTVPGRRVSILIDWGKEVAGYPGFRVRGAKGGEIIDVGYGEVLQDAKGGFVAPASGQPGRLNPDRDGVHYADRYVCREGTQEFQTFDRRGFRYMLIDVRNAPSGIEVDDVSLLFSTYPVQMKGAFRCSDERLNRIWEIGRYTCQLNMEDAYTDCPWRERGQWWGDARVEALINYYCFGDTRLINQALRQKGQSLNEEGMTWGIYPTDFEGGRLPSFTLIWVATLWETYLHTGDRAIVEELYPKIRKALDVFFAPRVGPRGLLKDIPYWVFIDWAPVDDRGEMGSLNAYYYDALRSAAAMGKLLNDPSGAEYGRRAEAVKQAINEHLWDADAHAYRDSILPDGNLSPKITQQTNSLCVYYDVAPAAEQRRILDAIYSPANKGKIVEAGSPYFSYYQLAALFHVGRHDPAMEYIRARWGRMLDWGATTWWETWNPGASFCHGWSGGPTYNLGSEYLGVKPLKPGFAEVSVTPHWSDLRFATGVIPTVKGDVAVAWQRDPSSGVAAVRVETQEGIPCEVTLPGTGEVKVNKKTTLPAGIRKLESPAGTQRFRIEEGGEALFELTSR
jgi:alpha-L-rhamnosidase